MVLREDADNVHVDSLLAQVLSVLDGTKLEEDDWEEQVHAVVELLAHLPG